MEDGMDDYYSANTETANCVLLMIGSSENN